MIARGRAVGLFGVSMLLNGLMSVLAIPIVTGIAGAVAGSGSAEGSLDSAGALALARLSRSA